MYKGEIKQKSEKTQIENTAFHNINVCLFCNEKFETLAENMLHMQTKHSFFILEEDYCTNK